jgi:hypothetical protein
VSMSEKAAHACQTWPRVYLDSAEIIGIAEGRTDPRSAEALVSAMRDNFAILVVSIENLQEALPAGDPGAPCRVADALERFPLRAIVTRGPLDIEPRTNEIDIEIDLAANIREVLTAPEAAPKLTELSVGHDVVYAAVERGLIAARGQSRGRVPRHAQQVHLQSQVTLARGWMGYEVEPIVRKWETEIGVALSARDRNTIVRALEPTAETLRVAGPVMDAVGADRTVLASRIAMGTSVDTLRTAPGTFLAACLWQARSDDPMRKTRRSDVLDAIHVTHIPYVDVATCDREVFGAITRYVDHLSGSRRPAVFRNGRLKDVAEAVARLPLPSPSC